MCISRYQNGSIVECFPLVWINLTFDSLEALEALWSWPRVSINHPGSRLFRTQRASWTDANRPPLVTVFFLFISKIVLSYSLIIAMGWSTGRSTHTRLEVSSSGPCCAISTAGEGAEIILEQRGLAKRRPSPPDRRWVLLWVIVLEAIELLRRPLLNSFWALPNKKQASSSKFENAWGHQFAWV